MESAVENILIVNGFDNSYMSEFGCSCDRCKMNRRKANTSVSLIQRSKEPNRTIQHILFDCGAGVVDSLCENPYLQGTDARLDYVFLTHWHSDHTSSLVRGLKTFRRSRERLGEKPKPVPMWCRSNSARRLHKRYCGELNDGIIMDSGEGNAPGFCLPPISLEFNIKITPICVSHMSADQDPKGEKAPACAVYVVEVGGRKIVLLWDLDNTNTWIIDPQSTQERESIVLLREADYFFVDCNCFKAEDFAGENTNHIAFNSVCRYARALLPKQTILMHISGHEDSPGNAGWGWDDETWQRETSKIWSQQKLPGKVIVPELSQFFKL